MQLIDVATGWSERAAVFGRGQAAMEAGFRRILARLPFPLVHLHPDNGSEFFNDHLVRFFGTEITGLTLSRSRPYQKNDKGGRPPVTFLNEGTVRSSIPLGNILI